MSGHSKWSKVKHQKAVTDVVKAAAFTRAARAITVAAREGGGVMDPAFNFKLRLAIEKARAVNMPKENIERAIEKAKGGSGGELSTVSYEAIGPGNVSIIIEAATDNKQRTLSLVKNTLEHNNARMVAMGAISSLFEQKGLLAVEKNTISSDAMLTICLESGADDFEEDTVDYIVFTPAHETAEIRRKLEEKACIISRMEIIMKPVMTVPVTDESEEQLLVLIEKLEELEDVQHIFTNAE